MKLRLGIWQPPAPSDFQPLTDLEQRIGRKVDIVPWYQAWGGESARFHVDGVAWAHDHGALPMITWEPWDTKLGIAQVNYSLRSIADGMHDGYIGTWASFAAEAKKPILVRFAHEMNGDWYPWCVGVNGNTAADYIAAWRRIVNIFTLARAHNVGFVWCPNRGYEGASATIATYPGASYVDWLGIDGYNFGGEMGWRSFDEIFGDTYRQLVALIDKPIMIGETGCAEDPRKADWIAEAFDDWRLMRHYPKIEALTWFNEVGSGDWPLRADAEKEFGEVVQRWRYGSL